MNRSRSVVVWATLVPGILALEAIAASDPDEGVKDQARKSLSGRR